MSPRFRHPRGRVTITALPSKVSPAVHNLEHLAHACLMRAAATGGEAIYAWQAMKEVRHVLTHSSGGFASLTISCGDSDALAPLCNARDSLAKAEVQVLSKARHDGPVAPHHHAVRAPEAAILLVLVPVRQRDL